jgi:ribulose-5-phosphate 4-epimerase/fuculose-1-phosphate aldolase
LNHRPERSIASGVGIARLLPLDKDKMTDPEITTQVSQVPSELLRKYIHGCHILHHYDLVDAYGHLSVRLSRSTFLMSRYMAPALVASPDDLVIYKAADGEPVNPNAPRST